MVGPHMPWPMMNMPESLPNAPSSCCQITRSIGVAPRPPYSLGQCRQAQPASAFFFCQAFATWRMLASLSWVRPSEDLRNSSSYCFGALVEIQALASARNAASWGVSSKFIVLFLGRCIRLAVSWAQRCPSCGSECHEGFCCSQHPAPSSSRRIPLAHALNQRIFPIRHGAEHKRGGVGATVIQVAIELPGEPHAAVDLDVVLGAMLERLACTDARRGGCFRQFRSVGRQRPGPVITIRSSQSRRDVHIREHVLHGLERTDRPAKGPT